MRLYLAAFIVTLLATMGLVMAIGPILNNSGAEGYIHTSNSTNSTPPTTLGLPPVFLLYNSTTKLVNESVGATLKIKSPIGYNMTMVILPGTYANVSGVVYSTYNVTLSTFKAYNLHSPPNTTYTPKSAFLFKLNGNIVQTTAFVNKTGSAPNPIIFTVNHGTNWTSYSYINEYANGTGYQGGSYSLANKWTYNISAGTMSNNFQKAQMHIYELIPGPASTTPTTTVTTPTSTKNTTKTSTTTTTVTPTAPTTPTNSSTTSPPPSTSSTSYTTWIIAIIVILVIIAVIYFFTKKK